MTDQQTANRILEKVKFKSKDKAEIWALREAQDALIKRSPTKVKHEESTEYGCETAYCPSCEWGFEEYSDIWGEPFCPHCGQALDWETESEANNG